MSETSKAPQPAGPLRRLFRGTGCLLLTTLAVLVLVEGVSSVVYIAVRLFRDRALAEERYTRYDPDLGWVSEPGTHIPDMYGPGVFLRIGAQGFRGERSYGRTVPPGLRRVVCSGDSYTFGYGVDDDHTWCHLLTRLIPGLETVNMGQGGYGIDQAFLWYRRDGVPIEHQAQLFAFVTDDFNRMQSDRFIGYGKPLLRMQKGALAVTNMPVPRPRFLLTWLAGHRGHFEMLASVRLARAVASELGGDAPPPAGGDGTPQAVAAAIFRELRALHRARGSRLALVYLPTPADVRGCESDGWRRFTAEEARRLGIPFLDLVEAIRELPPAETDRFFLQGGGGGPYFGAAGHYTEKGNDWVARRIAARAAELGLAGPGPAHRTASP